MNSYWATEFFLDINQLVMKKGISLQNYLMNYGGNPNGNLTKYDFGNALEDLCAGKKSILLFLIK